MRARWALSGLIAAAMFVVACDDGAGGESCIEGRSIACACTGGMTGAQVCLEDGTYGACECTGGPDGGAQVVDASPTGADASPGSPDAAPGSDDAAPGAPDGVPADAAACPIMEPEWCDGLDNDCNGIIDDMEVCPDSTVGFTEAFTEQVYLLGTTSEGSCSADALQAFWPTLSVTYFNGFDCYANWYGFRPTDDTIFYQATFSGIHEDVTGFADPVVDTPPCYDSVPAPFGFDGSGLLHYRCSDTLRRGNGVLVAFPIQNYIATLADGRSIVVRAAIGTTGSDYVLVDDAGVELSRVSPHSTFSGSLVVVPGGASVDGNKAYVAFRRTYNFDDEEIVVFRVDETDTWERVRRAPVDGFGYWQYVISDGTVFIRERDPLTTFDDRILAYLPDGTVEIAWREADAVTVRAHIGDQMLVGP